MDENEHLIAFGHRAHHGFITHLVQERIAVAALRFIAGLIKRRLAKLDGMVLDGLFLGAEAHQVAIGEERKSMAGDALGDFLLDKAVRHQRVEAGHTIEKDVQKILTVGRLHRALEHHLAQLTLVAFQFASLQIVAIGKNQPVLLR